MRCIQYVWPHGRYNKRKFELKTILVTRDPSYRSFAAVLHAQSTQRRRARESFTALLHDPQTFLWSYESMLIDPAT